MTMVTIKEYLKTAGEDPLIRPTDKNTAGEVVMASTFQSLLADTIKMNYGKLCILPSIVEDADDISDIRTEIRSRCSTLYKTNSYKYNTTDGSMKFEYDPIINNYREEDETINSSKSTSGSTTIGQQSNSTTIGQQSNSKSIGQQSNSVTEGAQSNSKTFGSSTDTENSVDSHGESAYDVSHALQGDGQSGTGTTGNSDYNAKTRDIHGSTVTKGQRQDSESIGQKMNSETLGSRSDSETLGSRSDSETLGSRSDSMSGSETNGSARHLEMKGNVGTMTTQDMIKQEREVALINFVEMVASDVISKIALRVY